MTGFIRATILILGTTWLCWKTSAMVHEEGNVAATVELQQEQVHGRED